MGAETVSSQDYIDSIGTRTDDQPRKRAELADRLSNAAEALEDSAAGVCHRSIVELEGWDDAREEQWPSIREGLERFRNHAQEFVDAATEAKEFLKREMS
jgi:hypothetical protein